MSPPPGPQRSVTVQEVDAWLRTAQEQLAQLHLHAARAGHPFALHEAFTAMSALLQESFEEMRVMSEATREWSQGARSEAVDLRTHAAQLMERGVTLMARMAQFTPPPPEAMQEAESRLLAMFRDDTKPEPR
jgi:hypothetical protein